MTTLDELCEAVSSLGIPWANERFVDGMEPEPPFILIVAGYDEPRYADGSADRFNDFVGVGGGINTALHNVGKSLEKNAGNSTVGNNGKAYWHAKGERGFYGNQHVKTIKLTKVGNMVTKVTGPVGHMLNGFNIYNGYLQDGRQFGYNTALAVGSFVGGWIGASVGLRAGSLAGVTVGGVPGAIIGGATGGTAGAFAGSEIMVVNKIYRR